LVTLSQSLDDEGKVDESEKHNIEFLEMRKDAAEAFQPSKQALHLVPLLLEFAVVVFPY
jgi:hypothetical protein